MSEAEIFLAELRRDVRAYLAALDEPEPEHDADIHARLLRLYKLRKKVEALL